MKKCLFLIHKESPLEYYFFSLLFKGIQGNFFMDIPHVHKKINIKIKVLHPGKSYIKRIWRFTPKCLMFGANFVSKRQSR